MKTNNKYKTTAIGEPETNIASKHGTKGRPVPVNIGIGFLSEEENNFFDPADETAGTAALFPAQRR